MILIFGGTTEGRKALHVIDAAGNPYYYSTRDDHQQVLCKHGEPIHGALDEAAMTQFCLEHEIRLIIDAAHPFAEVLHRTIATVSQALELPVVRFERIYPPRDARCIWCESYEESLKALEQRKITRLLAMTGVQTIPRLRSYWEKQECWFRILDRPSSWQLARDAGFPEDRLVCYQACTDEELIAQIRPQAIITKESGESGFFSEKVEAALQQGVEVFVIQRPPLSESFYTVTGEHGLRHRVERLLPGFYPLRTGFTTGTTACAATVGALSALLTGESVSSVTVCLPGGEEVELPLAETTFLDQAVCSAVIKDSGDDPDVTNGSTIRSTVRLTDRPGVHFLQGEGVGMVTLPGLGLEVGEPAINPTPRRVIAENIERLLPSVTTEQGVEVTISVEKGEELAKKTFNARLGIVGGISIIGTSGIIHPFSSDAFVRSIRKEIEVSKAVGCDHLVINSGAKSERMLKEAFPDLSPQAFVHYGNFIGETLRIAEEEGIARVTLGIMIGKAVKLADGHLDTHSKKVLMNKPFLIDLARRAGCPPEKEEQIRTMTLARELWSIMADHPAFFELLVACCDTHCRPLYAGEFDIRLIAEVG